MEILNQTVASSVSKSKQISECDVAEWEEMKQMSLIEMDGFLKGKCIPSDLKVNETNAEYLVRKFGELESKLNEQREYYEGVISDGSKRIAELEEREILLPERSSMLHRTDFHDDYQTVMAYKVSEVIDAIRATGIRIKGE